MVSGPAAAELDDAPAVAFGGPPLGNADVLLKGLTLLGEVETCFATGVGFAIKRLSDGGGPAHRADEKDFDLKDATLVLDAQLVSGANLASGLCAQAVRLNAADITGARGHGARFEEARSPKPFVDAHRVHRELRNRVEQNVSGSLCDLPEIKMAGVTRCGHSQSLLVGGAIKRGADVCLAVRQRGEWNFEGSTGRQRVEVFQEEGNDALVLARTTFGDRILLNRLELQRNGFRSVALRQLNAPHYS